MKITNTTILIKYFANDVHWNYYLNIQKELYCQSLFLDVSPFRYADFVNFDCMDTPIVLSTVENYSECWH